MSDQESPQNCFGSAEPYELQDYTFYPSKIDTDQRDNTNDVLLLPLHFQIQVFSIQENYPISSSKIQSFPIKHVPIQESNSLALQVSNLDLESPRVDVMDIENNNQDISEIKKLEKPKKSIKNLKAKPKSKTKFCVSPPIQSSKRKRITKNKQNAKITQKINEQDREKNETKNIIKNFGKRIIKFVEENQQYISTYLDSSSNQNYHELKQFLKQKKDYMKKIEHLRGLWSTNRFQKSLRAISILFLRRYAYHYIFNSKVVDYMSHLKYRTVFQQILLDPQKFKNIKIA